MGFYINKNIAEILNLQEDTGLLFKVVYLFSYVDYDYKLKHEGKYNWGITWKDVKDVLNISRKTFFSTKKILKEIFKEDIEGILYTSNKYIRFDYVYDWVFVDVEGFRKVYHDATTRNHKVLGKAICLLANVTVENTLDIYSKEIQELIPSKNLLRDYKQLSGKLLLLERKGGRYICTLNTKVWSMSKEIDIQDRDKQHCCIYRITWEGGYCYIGQTINPYSRRLLHKQKSDIYKNKSKTAIALYNKNPEKWCKSVDNMEVIHEFKGLYIPNTLEATAQEYDLQVASLLSGEKLLGKQYADKNFKLYVYGKYGNAILEKVVSLSRSINEQGEV